MVWGRRQAVVVVVVVVGVAMAGELDVDGSIGSDSMECNYQMESEVPKFSPRLSSPTSN